MEIDKIYNEDNIETMRRMPNGFIDLVVTSPPYDGLRKYNGYCFDFETMARELYRVMKDGGVVVWIVNDATLNGSESGTSFRQALFFKEIGFNLHDTMIYEKANPIPQNHNRYEQCFEFMFVFSKGTPKTFNPILVKCANAGVKMNWGGRKTLMDNAQCRRHRDEENRITKDSMYHKNIFCYTIGGGDTGHPAVFPEKLARDHIYTWSNEGDLVYDPFMGSGTTGKMAIDLKRHFIGSEISAEYAEKASKRIWNVQAQLTLF